MKVKLIAALEFVELNQSFQLLEANGIHYYANDYFFESQSNFVTLNFRKAMGEHSYSILHKAPVIGAVEFEAEEIKVRSIAKELFLKMHFLPIQLWYKEDNCTNISFTYAYVEEIGHIHSFALTSRYSRADLTQKKLIIDKGMIDELTFMMKPLTDARNKYFRISRAMMFIQQARVEGEYFSKIAMYSCATECLFATSNTELAHFMSERLSLYLGNTLQERIEIYKFSKKVYNMRSKYLHGDDPQKVFKNEEPSSFVVRIDELLRKAMTKLFINPEILATNDTIDDFFLSQIFAFPNQHDNA